MKRFAMGWVMALALAGECGAALPQRRGARLPDAAIKALHSDDDEELE